MSLKPTLQTDHCGTCTKCIEVCPTQALRPRHMDVDKCISFRTIEDKDTSLKSLTKKTASWFFGCDLCQSVCPWNEKAHTKAALNEQNQSFKVTNESLNEIKEILKSSNKELMRKYKDFALNRARGNGLKRNALKLIYENKITELKDFLKSLELSEALQELKNEVLTHLDQKT